MAGASVGRSLPRPCSGRKTLRRCRNNAASDNVVFIDVDGDDVENIIVIDSPEPFSKKQKGKQRQQRVIICIDDEESTDNNHPDTWVKKRCNFSSGASSSKGLGDEESDDVEFVQENISSPVKISKCKRTYSGKASSRNRYGLGPESEDDFSNDEVEEDLSGSVREQWEKAFSKRKYESHNAKHEGPFFNPHHSDMEIDPVTEFSHVRYNSNNDTEGSADEQLKKSSTFCFPGKENNERNRKTFPGRGNIGGRILKSMLKERCKASTIDPLVEESKMNCPESQDDTLHSKMSSYSTCDITPSPNVDGCPVNETFSSSCVNEAEILPEKSGGCVGSAEDCMISEREKLKETDEYKKVMEEEWASRQRVLQAQAEEAKQLRRLRKRENAEKMRLLDMEKRQKQRVEEIRETNKKDEEQMNMKDLIRAEVRNELSKVEISCHDMASVLRNLGIQVGNELKPNADEVRVACKKALFAFHPDRASKSDTRQQVEAEEKFKLICRMKEKFSVA